MTRYSEDWGNITDSAERKKVQNRIAQRTYRNRLKKRIAELEQLNKALNSQTPFPQQLHDGEMSCHQQQPLPPPIPDNPKGLFYSLDTLREGNTTIKEEDLHTTIINRKNRHRRNRISEPPPTFQDDESSTPDTATRPLLQRRFTASTSQVSMGHSLETLLPEVPASIGDLDLSIKESTESNDNGRSVADGNRKSAVISNIESFNWEGLEDADTEIFFQVAREQIHRPVTTPVDAALNLNDTTRSLLQSTLLLSQTSDDRTTLHLAVENDRLYIVQLLLSRHADVRAQDRWGYTALHIAAMRGHEEMTSLLLSSYNATSSSLSSSSSSSSSTSSDLERNNVSQHGDLIEMTDSTGCTALHHAADNGHAGVVEILFGAGANPRAQNSTGATPLHLATAAGHETVVISLFQQATAAMNSSFMSGDTLTLTPPSDGKSTSPNNNNNKNNDGMITSNRNNSSGTVLTPGRQATTFQDHQLNTPPTRPCSTPGSNENNLTTTTPWSPMLGPLQDLPHIRDSYGTTPFHLAAESGLSLRIISIFLSVIDGGGGAIDALDDARGFSPLHYAAQKGHEEMVRMLLDHGAGVGIKARYGWSALHLAVQGGHDGIVAMLLERGAEVDERVEAWSLCI